MWKKTDSKPRNYQKLSGWWEIKNEENNVQEKNHTMERPSYPSTDARPAGSSHAGPTWDTWVQLVRKAWKVPTRFSHFFQLDVGLYPDEISYVCSSGSCYDQKGRFPSMFHFTLWVLLSFHLKPGRSCCLEEVLALYILFLCLRLLLWFGWSPSTLLFTLC